MQVKKKHVKNDNRLVNRVEKKKKKVLEGLNPGTVL